MVGYPLALVSKSAPYLASIIGGTFLYVLRTEIGRPNSDAASSGRKEVPLDASMAQIFLCRSGSASGGKGLLPKANPLMNGTGHNIH